MGEYTDFISTHTEIDWGALTKKALSFKSADKPFYDHWRNNLEKYCFSLVGATPRTISLFHDCEGDVEAYEDEIEKQRKGVFLQSCVEALINNTNHRRKCLERHLKDVFEAFPRKVLFGTLTFKPELEPKNDQEEDEWERKAIEWAYKHSDYFIMNRDYRPETGAFHLHLYIASDYISNEDWNLIEGVGFSSFKRAKWNSKQTSRYLTKYERHCLKASTKGSRVFYSSGVMELAKQRKTEGATK